MTVAFRSCELSLFLKVPALRAVLSEINEQTRKKKKPNQTHTHTKNVYKKEKR